MSARRFLDSNVLIYAHDATDPVKQAVAQQLITGAMRRGEGVISVQVLGEFFHTVVVRKKLLTAAEARQIISGLEAGLLVCPILPPLVREAIAIHERYQLRYWDSLIVATAREAGCSEIQSEDLNEGQDYGGVVVLNPFRPNAVSPP